MVYVVVIIAVIVGVVSYIINDGGFFAKLALACFVSIFGFLLLRVITGFAIFTALAKYCAVAIVGINLLGCIAAIFRN